MGTDPSGLFCPTFQSNRALDNNFFIPGTLSPDPGAVQSVLGPESLPLLLGLGPALAAESAATVTVGRTMSQAELDAMQATGRVQESFNNGVTSVTLPPNPNAYLAGAADDIFVQFDVPRSAIGAADGTIGKIFGPNSIFGPIRGITEMPPATNIVVPGP